MVPLDDEIDMLLPWLSLSQFRFMMFKHLLSTVRTLLDILIRAIRLYSILGFIYLVYTTAARIHSETYFFSQSFLWLG